MKKFLSLILAIVLVVGLLVPAVSAETGEAETKALATWTGGTSVTNNGTSDVLKDITMTMKDSGDALNAYGSLGFTTSTFGSYSAQPWYGGDFNADTTYGYLEFTAKTTGYENLEIKTILGNNGKAPLSYAVSVSVDGGKTWTKAEGTLTAPSGKVNTLDKATTSSVKLPAAAANQESVIVRIAQAARNTHTKDSNAGNLYVYEIALTGTVKGEDKPTEHETFDFAFLTTSDLHGQIYATDYSAGYEKSGTGSTGLTRIATYIKQMREKYGDNLFVSDIGDTIQGAPLTYYYAFNKPDVDDPAMKAFRTIGYDMWVVGNHEFNYGLTILNRQLDYLTSESSGKESQVNVHMANYLDAAAREADSTSWKTWKGYAPYEIKDFNGVKVAVIGFGNPNIAKWDIPENRAGIYFAGIYETYKHYETEMLEKADMIVVISHSGVGSEAVSGDSSEDSVKYLVEHTNSIDFVLSGHEHGKTVLTAQNLDGKTIPIVQPNTKAKAIGQVIVTYDKTDKKVVKVDAQDIDMKNQPVDTELAEILKPYEETTWNDYMLKVIGKATDDYPAAKLGEAPSAFMDLVNKVQILGAYDYTGKNTPDDPTDDTPAMLSISAPLTAGSRENLIPKGNIYLGDMFSLYRFENWFYQIKMTGKEVRTWLECSGTKIKADGTVADLTYYDVIYGEGFSYTLDYAKPEGSRVVKMTYNGKAVTDDQEFTVVVNNYRYNGGGGYVDYLNSNGCSLTPNDPARIIYSTQFDMLNGEDEGQARTLLIRYIEKETAGKNEGIKPEITSTWKIIASSDKFAGKTVILHSNDVHGAIDGYAYMAGLKEEYEAAGANVIVVDAGDYSQGTVYVSVSKGADAITMMNAAGYDVVTLGNHEFDYGYEQIVSNMKAFNGKVLCANVLKDGKSIYDGHTIVEKGGVKIGFFGLETPEASTKANPALIKGLEFPAAEKLYEIAKNEVAALKAEGADIIVCLAHLGVDNESEPNRSYDLYQNVEGIDFVIDGHSHTVMTAGKDGQPIQSTGTAFANVGLIEIDNATKKITANSLIKVDDTTPKDGEVAALAKKIKAGIDAAYGEVFAKTEVELNGAKDPGNRTQETNLGDLITDSMLWKIKQSAADLNIAEENIVAITNGGGIRATIKKGNITKKDVNTVLPFGNTVAVVYVTGAELLEALEASTYSTPGAIGGFPQVAGMKFTIDTTKEFDKGDLYPGSTYHQPKSIKRVSIQEINGKPFDPKATYAVVTNNFLAAGGDTYYAFASASSQFDTGLPLDEVLMEYITEELNATVTAKQYGQPQGRITVLTGSGEPKPGPKTADETDLTFYMITGVVALVGLGTCVMVRKKKEQE